MDEHDLVSLRQKASKLPSAERALWVLASRSGFDRLLRRRAEEPDLLLVEPADPFQ